MVSEMLGPAVTVQLASIHSSNVKLPGRTIHVDHNSSSVMAYTPYQEKGLLLIRSDVRYRPVLSYDDHESKLD